MAIHDAGMFTVKEINRLKILHDVIDRGPGLLNLALTIDHFKLTHVGSISVGPSGGQFSSPSDLHDQLSKLADEKGGKFYVITAAREHGPNFEATAEVYK